MRIGEKPEIARLPLFREMAESQRDIVLAGSYLQVFPPQLTLFEAGQSADFLHVLVDGLVELFVGGNGRDTTMRIVEPVSSFILAAALTDMPYLMSARTLASSRILLIPASQLRRAIGKDSALMQAAMHELALWSRDLVRALTDMKVRQSAERLGNYLLEYSSRSGNREKFELRGEKRLLASLLGMTPENLSRAFGTLKNHGVALDGAQVTIENLERLRLFARPDPVPSDPR
ncbi:transcriptional regulator, Crp /Fnr family [Altererythrobacter epoxidivorans]|uniref:Transcriptional regulator, Crp /Fnr family n=1 Tax=Altererythrobacter epoxidivorans TaxID=361183 RepID=A0A0M4MEI2_9SPHN|nr:cyclic nucleotide-binding domain-containing protein [Altererythrobacter epoxidivorans]ALE15443.1 transcriptional regulator, Crp /Fnr family [Altererythrobacter epoxidivorans]